MLSKFEAIDELNNAVFAFIIKIITLLEFVYNIDFHLGIFNIEFLVLTNFSSHNSKLWVLIINAFDDLAKCTCIYNSDNFIPVA